MYIYQLSLYNIRAHQEAVLTFSKGINIITGHNNSGKSTILKGVFCIQSPDAITIHDLRKTESLGNIHIVIDEIESSDKESFKIQDYQNFDSPTMHIIKILEKRANQIQPLSFYRPSGFPASKKVVLKTTPVAMGNTDGLQVFHAIHDKEKDKNFIYPFLSKRKNNATPGQLSSKDLHFVSDDFRFILAKVKRLTNPGHPRYQEFIELCNNILGFGIGIIQEENHMDNLGLIVDDFETIPIQQMGDGVIHIIGLLATILTQDNKLYLIEELEADLHPAALKALLQLIVDKSKNNQFILTTHSHIVLKHLGSTPNCKLFETDVIFTQAEKGLTLPLSSVREVENTPASRLALLEKLGYEFWDFDPFKAYFIFEESSAEQIIRDFLIPHFAPDLVHKIKTIAANGANNLSARFNALLQLHIYIHTNPVYQRKAWIFADGDIIGIENIKKLRERFPSWPEEHFIHFQKNNFEDYYPAIFQEKVSQINDCKSKETKREMKAQLLREVVAWIDANPQYAITGFATSAKEIIDHLKRIGDTL